MKILNLTDCGCSKHLTRHLSFSGSEAAIIECMIYSLPGDRHGHTYICEHGETHRLSFHVLTAQAAGSKSGF